MHLKLMYYSSLTRHNVLKSILRSATSSHRLSMLLLSLYHIAVDLLLASVDSLFFYIYMYRCVSYSSLLPIDLFLSGILSVS